MIRDPSDGSVKAPGEQWETVEQLQAEVARQDPKAGFSEKDRAAVKAATSANNWGLKSLDKEARKPTPAPTVDELRAHYAKHNLAFRPKAEEI